MTLPLIPPQGGKFIFNQKIDVQYFNNRVQFKIIITKKIPAVITTGISIIN